MGFLSDVIEFEKFNLKDMWKKIKDDPERLFVGAVDPFSTRMWNKTGIGKDWEPIVDQFGGAYGGKAVTFGGNEDGGVYKRAEEAGIDTNAGARMHDIAHVIAAVMTGGAAANAFGGTSAGAWTSKIPSWVKYVPKPSGGGQPQQQNQRRDEMGFNTPDPLRGIPQAKAPGIISQEEEKNKMLAEIIKNSRRNV